MRGIPAPCSWEPNTCRSSSKSGALDLRPRCLLVSFLAFRFSFLGGLSTSGCSSRSGAMTACRARRMTESHCSSLSSAESSQPAAGDSFDASTGTALFGLGFGISFPSLVWQNVSRSDRPAFWLIGAMPARHSKKEKACKPSREKVNRAFPSASYWKMASLSASDVRHGSPCSVEIRHSSAKLLRWLDVVCLAALRHIAAV